MTDEYSQEEKEWLEWFYSRFDGVVAENGYRMAFCPAHNDANRSLSFVEKFADSGNLKVRPKCHAGCKYDDVLEAAGLTRKDTFFRIKYQEDAEIVRTYDYTDVTGDEILHQTVRFEPKDFRQRRPDGKGGWVWSLNGVRRVLYRLPDVTKAKLEGRPVFVFEGEKDADRAAEEIGVAATTCPEGAGSWRDSHTEELRNADVVLVPDHDPTGLSHMTDVGNRLNGVAKSVRLLELPGLTEKGSDLSDWLDLGHTKDEFFELVKNARGFEPTAHSTAPRSTNTARQIELAKNATLATFSRKHYEWYWTNRLAKSKLVVIEGDVGNGKSVITVDIAARLTAGMPFPGESRAADPGYVIMLGSEDGIADTVLPRFEAAGGDVNKLIPLDTMPTEDASLAGVVPISIPENLDFLEDLVNATGAVAIVVDPIMSYLSPTVNAMNPQSMRRVMVPLTRLGERTGCMPVAINHFNKSGTTVATEKGSGAKPIIGQARIGLQVGVHPDHVGSEELGKLRVLSCSKANIGPKPRSYAYRLATHPEKGVVRVEWVGEIDITADELLEPHPTREERTKIDDAKEFLREELKDGPVAVADLKDRANSASHAWRTVERAKTALGVVSHKPEGETGWFWSLSNGGDDPDTPDGVGGLGLQPKDLQGNHVRQGEKVGGVDGGLGGDGHEDSKIKSATKSAINSGDGGDEIPANVHNADQDRQDRQVYEGTQEDFELVADLDGLDRLVVSALRDYEGELLGVDTETTDLFHKASRDRLLQITDQADNSYVVDLFKFTKTDLHPLMRELEKRVLVFHKATFDMLVLRKLGMRWPKGVRCTLLMHQTLTNGNNEPSSLSYLAKRLAQYDKVEDFEGGKFDLLVEDPDRELLDYAVRDTKPLIPLYRELERRLEKARDLTYTMGLEMATIKPTVLMAEAGLPVNVAKLSTYADELETERVKLLSEMDGFVTEELPDAFKKRNKKIERRNDLVNWQSNQQVGWAFSTLGVELETTEKGVPKCDKGYMAMVDHPLAEMVVRLNELKGEPTKWRNALANRTFDGRLFADWKQWGAKTGRYSCANPPLQGLPNKGTAREAISAPDGHKLISSDLSQIEVRVWATISRDEKLIGDLNAAGGDVYRAFAERVFGRDVTQEERDAVKACVLGRNYGMGLKTLRHRLAQILGNPDLSTDDAREYDDSIAKAYRKAERWRQRQMTGRKADTRTMGGRLVRNVEDDTQKLNYPIQGSAADVMKLIAVAIVEEIVEKYEGVKLCALIHDEAVLETPEDIADEVADKLDDLMRRVAYDYLNEGVSDPSLCVKVETDTKVVDNLKAKKG